MLHRLFLAARVKKQACISVERLLAALLVMPPVFGYLNSHLGSERAEMLRTELDSILACEPAPPPAARGMRASLRRVLTMGRGNDDALQTCPEVDTVLVKAFLRVLPKNYLNSTDLLLSVIENSQGEARALLERHGVTRHSLVLFLVRGPHARPTECQVDFPGAGGDLKVVLLDDDFTPQPFVVEVLESVFSMTTDEAERLMMAVHNNGRAVCGLFPAEEAQVKAAQIEALATARQHPLRSCIELP
nr:ATP-dependent Clp protease adaptor ClpS [Massilia eburnea]